MKAYELLYIVAPSTGEDVREAVNARIRSIVEEAKGTVDEIELWGEHKKLAYEIGDLADADYILVNFHSDPQSITELDRVLRINDAVVRHMVVARTDRD